MGSCLTHLLQETLGGNAKVAVICAISPDSGYFMRQSTETPYCTLKKNLYHCADESKYCIEYSSRGGTLSTLRFGDRAKQIQNKAVVNEITEDDVNDLSDQIRQLKVNSLHDYNLLRYIS